MKSYVHATLSSTGSWMGNIYDLTLLTYIYTELEKFFHINLLMVSLLFALGLIGRFFGGVFFGSMNDKMGSKIVMVIGTSGYAIFSGVMAFSPNVFMLFSARFIQGIFMGGEWTAGTVLSYEFAPDNVKGTIVGVVQSGYGIGYALTGVAYLLFLPTMIVNWRYFILTGITPLLIVPYAMMKIPSDKHKRDNNVRDKINLKKYKIPFFKSVILMSGYFAAYFSIFSFYPTIAPSFGISPSIVGFTMIVSNIVLAISFIVFGRLSLFIRKKYLIMAGSTISIIFAWFAIPFIRGVSFLSIPGLIFFTVGIGSMPIVPLLLMERVNGAVRGTISGISYNFGALFGGIISILLGFIGDITGYHSLLIIIDITTLLCMVSVMITGMSIKRLKESASYRAFNNTQLIYNAKNNK